MKCFVSMPLTDPVRRVYEQAIRPAVQEVFSAAVCENGEEAHGAHTITHAIVSSIVNADITIAFLSDPRLPRGSGVNANVMYELGIAHSFRKPTLIIADRGEDLPFDVKDVRAVEVDAERLFAPEGDANALADLKDRLARALRILLGGDGSSASAEERNPISQSLAGCTILVEGLPWLWGYEKTLRREARANRVWGITRSLHFSMDPAFFEIAARAVVEGRKRYLIVPDDGAIRHQIGMIREQLVRRGFGIDDLNRSLKFAYVKEEELALVPVPVFLYDPHMATECEGILCEPMAKLPGVDAWDAKLRELVPRSRREDGRIDLEDLLDRLAAMPWIEKRGESTFDLQLSRDAAFRIATAFVEIWNRKIDAEAKKLSPEAREALLREWRIQIDP